MDTYLCSPLLDLTEVSAPRFGFLTNCQAADNDLNDNGTPSDPTDDFDDDFLRVLVGTDPPSPLVFGSYTDLGDVLDHLDSSLSLSEETAMSADLSGWIGQLEVYVCFHYRATYAWYAQIDNAALRGAACMDADLDGVSNSMDNCPNDFNPQQEDFDGDGAGYACDTSCASVIDLMHTFGNGDNFELSASGRITFQGAMESGADIAIDAPTVVLMNDSSIHIGSLLEAANTGCTP